MATLELQREEHQEHDSSDDSTDSEWVEKRRRVV